MNNLLEKRALLDKTNTHVNVPTPTDKNHKVDSGNGFNKNLHSETRLTKSVSNEHTYKEKTTQKRRVNKSSKPIQKKLVNKIKSQFLQNKFFSPTDAMLSPCSQKINKHKAKLYKVKSTPERLSFGQTHDNDNYDLSDEDIDLS